MLVTIHRQHIEVPGDAEQVLSRRLRFALDRFAAHVRAVAVYLTDVNGPRGGVDKRCKIVAEVAGAGPVAVEWRESDFGRLFSEATGRLAEAVRRRLGRRLDRARRGHRHGGV